MRVHSTVQLQSAINSLKIELEIEKKQVEIERLKRELKESERLKQESFLRIIELEGLIEANSSGIRELEGRHRSHLTEIQ
jgi:hypothetical protein